MLKKDVSNKNENFNPVIIIMAKVPLAGFVKTRLKPFLDDYQCAELAACFLRDTAAKAFSVSPNVIVALTPFDGENEIRNSLPTGILYLEQIGNDLGEKLHSAFKVGESKNHSPIIVIGTDSPSLPPDYLSQAVNLFREPQATVIIGAVADGGFYLIGLRKSVAEIFENIEWSSERVFEQTKTNVKKLLGFEPIEIPVWYDVDTPDDLKSLYDEFLKNENFYLNAPETAKWLKQNEDLFKQ